MLNFRDYLNYAEKHLLIAEDEMAKSLDAHWLLIPATILAWSAIESFVNNRIDDFGSLPEDMFALHERAFLLEKRLKLQESGDNVGCFVLMGTEYNRLEDKIFFLIAKFGHADKKLKKGESLWQDFERFRDARNALVHPKQFREIEVTPDIVRSYIETSKEIIQFVSESIRGTKIDF
jgi:hypothetical protein